MEDGGFFRCGVRDRLVIRRDRRGRDLDHEPYARDSPLIGAIRLRGGRRGWRGDLARARETRAGHATCRRRLFPWRFQRVAQDQRIEPGKVERRIRPRRDEVVAGGPSGARRIETVGQQDQKRPGPQSRQSLERNGPHHTSVAERPNPTLATTSLEIVICEKGFRIESAVRSHLDNIPDRSVALQEDQEKLRQAMTEPRRKAGTGSSARVMPAGYHKQFSTRRYRRDRGRAGRDRGSPRVREAGLGRRPMRPSRARRCSPTR
jgi:hypothetical protein